MSATNKALAIIIAIVAFAIGASINSNKLSSPKDSQRLLSAELIVSHEPEKLARLEDHLSSLTLVNFWATWCAPCREEMPVFEAMYRQAKHQGFGVIGIAIDSPEKAQPMLDSMDISYPIFYAEQTGSRLMESVGNTNGLLPYSLLLDANGKILEHKIGKIDEQQILEWLNKHLK